MSDTPHAKYISSVISDIGKEVEDSIRFEGKRGHFVLLLWADGVVQSVSNTPANILYDVLTEHVQAIKEKDITLGVYPNDS